MAKKKAVTEMPDSVSLPLTKAIKFANKSGAMEDVFELEIRCHTKKHYKKTLFIKQAMTKAMFAMRQFANNEDLKDETAEEDDEKVFDRQTVMVALNLSDVDLEDLLERFEKLAQTGVVRVEGKALNPIQLAALDPDDLEAAMGEYIANFIVPSVMKIFGST